MYDDYLATQMFWTKQQFMPYMDSYVDLLGVMADPHPEPVGMVTRAHDLIARHLNDELELPTWHEVYFRAKDKAAVIRLELGPDFRLNDWMKANAREYGVEDQLRDW